MLLVVGLIATTVTAVWQWHPGGLKALLLGRAGAPAMPATPAISRPVTIPPPLPGGDSSVSPEPLRLLLIGTRMGARVEESVAFIGTARRNPQTYSMGALLANGARIVSIMQDCVVLERNGVRTRLSVTREPQMLAAERKGRAGAIDSVGGPVARLKEPPTSTDAVTEVIRPRPVFEESGRFVGYELKPGAAAGAFTDLGLQPGDRLVATDGVPIDSVEQGAAALEALASGATVSARLQRGGSIVAVRLDGQRLIQHGAAGAAPE